MSEERIPKELAHLRTDAEPVSQCFVCGRKSWVQNSLGLPCGLPHPCRGTMRRPVLRKGLEPLIVASSHEAIRQIKQQTQRQDSLDDQLRDVQTAAVKLGCYDAADWIRMGTLR